MISNLRSNEGALRRRVDFLAVERLKDLRPDDLRPDDLRAADFRDVDLRVVFLPVLCLRDELLFLRAIRFIYWILDIRNWKLDVRMPTNYSTNDLV